MPETNGRGWKVAAILGGLLCGLLGASIVGITYTYGLVREVESLRSQEEHAHRTVQEIVQEMALTRGQLRRLERAITRLADAQCFDKTGKPCPHDILDERP